MRHTLEWTRSNRVGLLVVTAALGGFLVWTGAYSESAALIVLLLLVFALLGAGLRAMTSLFTLAGSEDIANARTGRRRRAMSSRAER